MDGRKLFAVLIAGFVSAPAFAQVSEESCIAQATSIQQKLICLKDVRIVSAVGSPLNTDLTQIELRFRQPINHDSPADGTFEQRVVLLHRSTAEPMVLQTSGYSIFSVREATITSTFATNQLQVEHRFFTDSVPESSDWSELNIRQSAADFHRITVALKKVYPKNWVNTGASKGGMTSVYHRYFYPDDLSGTVADVAPLSFSTADERYVDFLRQVGGATYAACRTKFRQFQLNALRQRESIVPRISGQFSQLGSADVAFEHAVIESEFIFWQYKTPTDPQVGCSRIPTGSEAATLLSYLQQVNPLDSYADDGIAEFMPYFYQAATELGNPGYDRAAYGDLLKYDFTIDQYTPQNLTYSYSNQAMIDVDNWVRNQSERILFVVGEYDPWSAAAFTVRDAEHETFKLVVPKGNHGSKFSLLPAAERSQATALISRWLGKSAVSRPGKNEGKSLEDAEFQVRMRVRL